MTHQTHSFQSEYGRDATDVVVNMAGIQLEPTTASLNILKAHSNISPLQWQIHRQCLQWLTRRLTKACAAAARSSPSTLGFLLSADGHTLDPQSCFRFLSAVADATAQSTDPSVAEIAAALPPPAILLGTRTVLRAGQRTRAVFAAFGWLTLLYVPDLSGDGSDGNMLAIAPPAAPASSPRFRRRREANGAAHSISISVGIENGTLHFAQLAALFGQRVPERWATVDSPRNDATIHASNVFFSNLLQLGHVRLRSASRLGEHLDFDEHTRTLKVLGCPAYCALVCLSDPESTAFLNKFVGIPATTTDPSTGLTYLDPDPPFDDFCREILVTFGVLFGQDARSRQAAAQHMASCDYDDVDDDPVLRGLCATRWPDHELFTYLDAPPVRANYSAACDFPFLGAKLLRLQEYMEAQSPNDFRTLLMDRRDHLRFWTLVSVLGFGIVSIVLGVLQVALAAGQIAVSKV